MLKAENILDAIGEIDDKVICSVKAEKRPASRKWIKWVSLAAGFCILAVAAVALHKLIILNPGSDEYTSAEGGKPSPGGISLEQGTEQTSPEQAQPVDREDAPVYYSDLMLAEGEINEDVLGLSESSIMDIKEFDESALSQDRCCMIIEGTVTDLYVKRYNYDVYSDKFEENGILHSITDTVVYEITVDKTWYGADISGQTILIEDTSYFTEPILSVKKGKKYVLPLYEYGGTVWTGVHEYAGGNITRESSYSTIYPYHPQIEVTLDGSYLISQDWATLVERNAREVIMDTSDGYDQGKMYLVDGNTFAEQMELLCNAIRYF